VNERLKKKNLPGLVLEWFFLLLGTKLMKAILGRKIGMSQVFREDGEVVPVTLVQAEPNVVGLRRSEEKDGVTRIQLGLKKPNHKKGIATRREFEIEVSDDISEVTVEQFAEGDVVSVAGISKGKGFQGVVKRHHFAGGPASHGHRHVLRRPGSIGCRFPQHVRKGKRMAGRMGADRVTVKNLVVMAVDKENNVLAIKGAVPGKKGTVLEIISV
jgi:large subunit ribosomal protein L3